MIKKLILGLTAIFLFLFIVVILFVNTANYDKTTIIKATSIPVTITPAKTELKIYDLHNGNYISGKDFDHGTYDITSSGIGNVISSNMYNGGINLVSPNEAKNIKLPSGTELKIMGITDNLNVHMVKK